MKGIVLAGGSGTRLWPVTKSLSKQLIPVYDKPMIYYPISVLMLGGIKDILIISTPKDIGRFQELLGDGKDLGVSFSYAIQEEPRGIAEAFLLAKDFIDGDDVTLILGDNIFYGHGLTELIQSSVKEVENSKKSVIFGYRVNDPQRYGVVEFDKNKNVKSIVEKPLKPKSNYAVVGLYIYPNDVIQKAKLLKPSQRGELEITDLNNIYLNEKRLMVKLMGRGYSWFDTGTHDSLLEASIFVYTIEKRQGLKIASLEEIALQKGYISKDKFLQLAQSLEKSSYGKYLKEVVKEEI